jgi:hypothetical protein
MVNRAGVTRFASLVAGFGAESARFLYVARVALGGKDGVRRGNSPAAVHVIVTKKRVATKP